MFLALLGGQLIPALTEFYPGPGVSLAPSERNQPPLHLGFGMLLILNLSGCGRVPYMFFPSCSCLPVVN